MMLMIWGQVESGELKGRSLCFVDDSELVVEEEQTDDYIEQLRRQLLRMMKMMKMMLKMAPLVSVVVEVLKRPKMEGFLSKMAV